MGFFDVHCAYSGLALAGDTRLVLLAKEGRQWVPIAAPIVSTYNRLGGLDEAKKSPAWKPLSKWLASVTGQSDFHEAMEALADGEATWNDVPVAYTLVDEGVYQALKGGVTSGSDELPAALRGTYKTALGKLTPIDFEDGDQYTGLRGESGCAKRITRAKKRFAGDKAMLKAIASNEATWQERDDDDDDHNDDAGDKPAAKGKKPAAKSKKRDKVLAVISEQTGIPVAKLTPDRNLYTDLGIVPNSDAHGEIDCVVRDLRADVGYATFSKCATVGDLLTLVDGGPPPEVESFVWDRLKLKKN